MKTYKVAVENEQDRVENVFTSMFEVYEYLKNILLQLGYTLDKDITLKELCEEYNNVDLFFSVVEHNKIFA